MSGLHPGARPSNEGWWAVDVAGYLLTRIALLGSGVQPATLDPEAVIAWIRANELDWAPGCADPREEIPWDRLRSFGDDAALVEDVLRNAARELQAVPPGHVIEFAAKRTIPTSTLMAYGYAPARADPAEGPRYADGHVHQGAALPLDVTVHWVARAMREISGTDGPIARPLEDTAQKRFNPFPLLLLIRVATEHPREITADLLELAARSATGDAGAWNSLNGKVAFDSPMTDDRLDLPLIEALKRQAQNGWAPAERVALLRLDAILHGAVTQRQPGLDEFVDLFGRFSDVRRSGGFDKQRYYERSITSHVACSDYRLDRLELRLGERINGNAIDKRSFQKEYKAALEGYRAYVRESSQPVRVTFPLGFVKSRPGEPPRQTGWRFDPGGIYRLTELLLEVMDDNRSLARFVDGIDVCGFEEGEPNWLFAPAFTRFAEATQDLAPPPACRFHAGEWQWTPLHGLRRMSEFLQFPLPPRTPRRIGHGLALRSNDWRRIEDQPLDELLDDLLWVRSRLPDLDVPSTTWRIVDRLILDTRALLYEDEVARRASADALVEAYFARFDVHSLELVDFLARDGRSLRFPNKPPAQRPEAKLQLLVAHLRAREDPVPTVAEAFGEDVDPPSTMTVHALQQALADLYDTLVVEVTDDIRWGGVVVEACPTSNIVAGGVRGHVRHPMRELVERGLLMTINTDDPSIFHAWIPDETSNATDRMLVPRRQVERASRLGLQVIAPGLDGVDIDAELRQAIDGLDVQPVRR